MLVIPSSLPILSFFLLFASVQLPSSVDASVGGLLGALIDALTLVKECEAPLSNWGGNLNYSTTDIRYPKNVAEVQMDVGGCTGKVRALGTRHSFTTIADSPATLISTQLMSTIQAVVVDYMSSPPTATVPAGITYTDLCPLLQIYGLALPNLAALAEVSVGGALATSTHGSGVDNQILGSSVSAITLVLANGTVKTLSQPADSAEMLAVNVGLGSFGIVTSVKLNLVPTYTLQEWVFENLPLSEFQAHTDEILGAGYSVSLFPNFQDPNTIQQLWVITNSSQNLANVSTLFNATAATTTISPSPYFPSTYLGPQLGVPGPWYERITAYGFGKSGFQGNEIQSEYMVPYENASASLTALLNAPFASAIAGNMTVCLIRTIAADEFWMSYAYHQKRFTYQFSFLPNIVSVTALLKQIDSVLGPMGAVPHWGKFFTMSPSEFLPRYPKRCDWIAMAQQYDPLGKFRNQFMNDNVFTSLNGCPTT